MKAFSANPCCQNLPPFCGSFEVGGEALFFRPRLCDLDVAIHDGRSQADLASSPLPTGQQLSVPCHSTLGWRILLGYLTQGRCFDARLEYTGIHQKYSARLLPGAGCFWICYGSPGSPGALNDCFADGNALLDQQPALLVVGSKINFDAIDIELASRRWPFCHLWVRTFIGVHVASIQHKFHIAVDGYAETEGGFANLHVTLFDERRAWGAGPRVGAELLCRIGSGFNIAGRAAAAILTGENRGTFTQSQRIQNVPGLEEVREMRVRSPDAGVVIPAANARLGVGYCLSCSGFLNLSIEFGYELLSYINVISRCIYNQNKSTSSLHRQSFTIDGFYLSFLVQL